MIVADRQGRILDANGEATRMSGFGHSELLAMHLPDCVMPEEAPRLDYILKNLVEGKVEEAEWYFRRNDGTRYLCEVGLTLLAGGLVLLTGRDITERRRAGNRLRESDEKYRNLFDSIDEGFCTIEMLFDGDGKPVDYRFLEINPALKARPESARTRLAEESAKSPRSMKNIGLKFMVGSLQPANPSSFENMAAHFHRWYEV